MGRTYDTIEDRLGAFVLAQPVFFVASAPLGTDGLVNCSPKSNDGELVVLAPRKVAYLDRTGSGIETVAHLRENGRIVLMFCSFEGPPRVVRLHGRGSVVVPHDSEFDALTQAFPAKDATTARSVVVVDVTRISDSCGYGVPLMGFTSHRTQLGHWAATKGEDGLASYRAERNAESLDGLPGLSAS